jgi:hypothetical protein
MRTASLIFAVAVLTACGDAQPDHASEEPSPACVEQPFRAALHVDAGDPRGSWATDFATGRDLAVRARPPGRFTIDPSRPTELRDGEGKLVSFDGEISATGCVDAVRQIVYLGPNDLPDPNRPGG